MKLNAAPDSVYCESSEDGRGRGARLEPWIWLAWLVWLFGPVVIPLRGFPHWLVVSLLSLPVFLALHIAASLGPRRFLVAHAIAMAVLACLVSVYNPFAQTYIIYACAIGAAWSTPRKSGALVLVLLAAYSVEWMLLRYPWESMVNAWILCPIIAGLIITRRITRRHQADLRLSMDEVRRLAASAERERIGRDLHDLLGHTLSMVTLKSELAGRLIERDPAAARREMADVERVSRDALAQVRSAVSGIRAAALASELASARLMLETAGVQMEYLCDPQPLPVATETCMALVLREAITNIQRHARANRVEVSVIAGSEQVVMRIRDDGRGGVNERGNGLTGMRERIAACGGELQIDSPRGKGTAIEIRLPLAPMQREPGGENVVPLRGVRVAQPAGGRA